MVDLAIIGAGPGGYEAAGYAAKQGLSVALFERGQVGGTCLNVGCIPTKTLLRSGRALAECREAARYGVDAGEPAINMARVQERKKRIVSGLRASVTKGLKKAGVDLVEASATVLGAGRVEAAGEEYEAQHILLATGSRPAQPPIPGLADSEAVLDSTAILELVEIPESLAIIGGGVIGLEFACFFAELGTEVTVVEMMPRIAPVIDAEIAKRLRSVLKRQGVAFHLSSRVTAVAGNTLTFGDAKGAEQTLSTTWILNATGRVPVTDGLGLEEAGVDVERGAVRTDELGRTNVPGIWACGDVTGRCLLAHSATREGFVAVNNILGRRDRMRFDAVPSVVYTHPEVASVGPAEEQLEEQGVACRKVVMPMAVAGRFTVEYERQSGTVKVLLSEEHGQVLAVHMIGGCCGEFIASAAAMVELELRVQDVAEIVFPHPTVSESLKETILHGA